MARVAILSDTHVPSRAEEVPEWVQEEILRSDYTIHAGDFDSTATFSDVASLATDLTAVRGNMDPASLDLPAVATLTVDGVTFVVTHGTGDLDGYEDRVVAAIRDERPDAEDESVVGVAGHTHQVWDRVVDGVRVVNPGSATGVPPATTVSMMTAVVEGEEYSVTIHEAED